jgi:DNA mismatch repair protein MutS
MPGSTPARRQYLEIKGRYPDTLLAYQVGDFFEFFDDDARIASVELQIVLTARAYGADERVPLAGVPLHALDTYLARLVGRGYKVAICEQVGPTGKGLVQRAVTRILTPGTITEPGMLPARRDTYLVAVNFARRDSATGLPTRAGLAYADASTGAFACTEWEGDALPDALRAELQRLAPAELLVAQVVAEESSGPPSSTTRSTSRHGSGPRHANGRARDDRNPLTGQIDTSAWLDGFPLSPCPDSYFDQESARIRLCRHFATPTLAAFGCERQPAAASAAGAILAYLERMQPALLRLLTGLQTYDTRGFVEMDGRTWRALEVIEPGNYAHGAQGAGRGIRSATLLATLDATRTAAGARLLRRTLLQPLRERATLESRLDAVAEVHRSAGLRQRLSAALSGLADLQRLAARLVHGSATPREMHALAATLGRVPEVAGALRDAEAAELRRLHRMLDSCEDVRGRIERAVVEPHSGTGRLLRAGHDGDLDALVDSVAASRRWIAALEGVERERTGIRSLRVGFNKVFGYYIEVSRPNLARVPADYQRRQTLATGERFVTAELKEHEALVLHAEEQIGALEKTLYAALLVELAEHQSRLRTTATALAQADVYLALAEVAHVRGYIRPELSDDSELRIEGGRHPVVEATLDGAEFIANDTAFDDGSSDDGARILLLTGPNMAGKSTYLRQVATIALLAQIGSFVPARRARIGLVDRIFTRVGAEDDLARGLSTFMLEMVETAYILRHATARSLVILDEVGRGTSTSDGVALARAVVEHLHDRVGVRTLFATHYHELAALGGQLARLRVARMEVAERAGEAIFLHRVVPGASNTSYGVQVARMAGLPTSVTERAAELLGEPETEALGDVRLVSGGAKTSLSSAPDLQLEPTQRRIADGERGYSPSVSSTAAKEIMMALASINVAATTPIEAINLLFSLQQRALAALQMPATLRVERE